jgi:hypothetical protein
MAQRDRRPIKTSPLHLISAETAQLDNTLDAAPDAGLAQGRTSDAKPASILRTGSQGNVSRGT